MGWGVERCKMKETIYKDSYGNTICIGDLLDIIATNQYSGEVNETDGVICLETVFFNKPLEDHLTANDIQEVRVCRHFMELNDLTL